MRFQLLDIVFNPPHPVTGEAVPPADRLARTVRHAVLAEELGFDSFAVGERHAGDVLSSAPTVILGAIAASTSRILLSTGVTVLSLLDPVRVAEDLATVDQLSRGRLENYELLRLLLSQEDVTWEGRHRHRLEHATTLPRPYAGPFRVWPGSATSRFAVELAAPWGDPIVTANALQPRETSEAAVAQYRPLYQGQVAARVPEHSVHPRGGCRR